MRERGGMRLIRGGGARLAVSCLLAAHLAGAQAKSPTRADALFKEAVALAQSGDYGQAADKFRESYELEPSPGALQGLAMAEERAGRLAKAHADFTELARVATERNDKKRLKLAKERLAAIEPRLGKLTLSATRSPPDGARLRLDGTDVPLSTLGSEVVVDPGPHAIEGTAPDGSSFTKQIQVGEGRSEAVSIEWVAPAPPASVEPARPAPVKRGPKHENSHCDSRTLGLIVGGTGVVLAGVGTYFAIRAGKTFDDVQGQCPNDRCPTSLRDKVDSGRQQDTIARIGLALGGAAIATGVVLYIVGGPGQRSEEPPATSVGAFVGPRDLGLTGRF